jgi:uracil-DNA glycosylase family 4
MDEGKRIGDSLSAVAAEVSVCTRCPLSLSRTKAVPGEGPSDARVVIIGEGPGRSEDVEGRPFVGAAGRELERLLKNAGLRREDVFITNVVKCRPPDNRRPTSDEADACDPYLQRQLDLIRPKVVVLLGDSALKRFLPGESLGKAHGKLFDKELFALFATYHPAAMMYNRSLESVVYEDFKTLEKILGSC